MEGEMKAVKLGLAIVALSFSASASAMPSAVPGKWYDLMFDRLTIMAHNSGFCKAQPESWICDTL
jgi:hypothetical protein